MKCWKSLDTTQRDVEEYIDKVELKKGWLTQYNRRHNFSSPFRLDEVLEDWTRYQHEVVMLMKSARDALAEVFDHYTQSEWIEQKLYPLYQDLSTVRNEADRLRRFQSWPRRPFEPLEALKGLGIGLEPTTVPSVPSSKPRRLVQQPDNYSRRSRRNQS